jgi:hypothetical protein
VTPESTDTTRAGVTTLNAVRGSSWVDDQRSAAVLRFAAWFYAIAWAVHTGDHLRRGFSSITSEVTVLGTTTAVLQIAAVVLVLTRNRWAPLVAVVVGLPDGIGIAAVHLLPHWSSFSDAFPGAHGTGVTGFSWFAAIVEIIGALTFAAAGAYCLKRSGLPDRHRARPLRA